jgi:nicotinate-nucleotide adenylyltransferase
MRVGVLGGTFDPIHIGHLIVAEEAYVRLGLSRVVFVPAGEPPHKLERRNTDPERRWEMVRLAIADNEHLSASRVDLDRPGPAYTVDTIRLLQQEWGLQTQIFFLMGVDSLSELPTWHQPQRLLSLCQVVAVQRPRYAIDLDDLERQLPGVARLVRVLEMPGVDISSTAIRGRIRQGLSIRYLVPASVERYINDHGLYRDRPCSGS